MSALQVLPILAYLLACLVIGRIALAGRGTTPAGWIWPAGLGAVFLLVSLWAVAQEGLLQFWVNHTTTLVGNQVWFDLLIAVSLSFYLLAPRARAVGMALLPWAIAVILTASIALLPMLARVLWLEHRARGVEAP